MTNLSQLHLAQRSVTISIKIPSPSVWRREKRNHVKFYRSLVVAAEHLLEFPWWVNFLPSKHKRRFVSLNKLSLSRFIQFNYCMGVCTKFSLCAWLRHGEKQFFLLSFSFKIMIKICYLLSMAETKSLTYTSCKLCVYAFISSDVV